jgi:hypothetical protein
MKPKTEAARSQACLSHHAQNRLLLVRHTGKRPRLAHEDKVATLRSNLRWCSNGFEIPCWNGQVVRVAFALDYCDREVISQWPPLAVLPVKWCVRIIQ